MTIVGGLFAGKLSDVVASLVVIPLVCAASILFYRLGAGVGSERKFKSLMMLRSAGGAEESDRIAPLISGFDARVDFNQATTLIDSDFDPDRLKSSYDAVPPCARDVFVTLHKEAGGEDESSCKGLLIRDDIVITSKECSRFKFTFDFPGFGIVRAIPHPALNSNEDISRSRLGFLEAHPPYHYHFVDHPIRRTRIFLSKRSNLRVDGTDVGEATVTCGEKGEPIAHNFPVRGGSVPLAELEGIVPDDVLWEETDLGKARKLSYKSHRWWTRPITLDEEQWTFKNLIEQYRGPPGSVSVPDAHSNFLERAGAICEVVDPRGHRRQDCFNNYYLRYQTQSPFSGVHFFDWLDFGGGKHLLENSERIKNFWYVRKDEKCHKADFNRKKVHYFDDEMRAAHEVYFRPSADGRELIARYRSDDRIVPQSHEDRPHLYMWDLEEKFYVVDDVSWDHDRYGTVKHTGVVAGRPALSGGKAYFGKDGVVWGINYSSGHYRPDIGAAALMYQWMKNEGFNVTALHWVGRTSWSTKDCVDMDWTSIKIKGYDAASLNRSCREMTVSPTWILKDDV